MSDYRRLISYIYAYEGAVKGKNIGFAKLESRNGQCRIGVSVRKVYVGGNDMGVYLLSGRGEILLGKIFIRSGSGEFRTAVKADDVEGSGSSLDSCYGLTVHDIQDSWRSYTTIWDDGAARDAEDTVTQAAEIELSGITAENLRKEHREKDENKMTPFQLFQAPPPQITADFECSGAIVAVPPLSGEDGELYGPAPERWSFGGDTGKTENHEAAEEKSGQEHAVKDGAVSRYMSGTASVRTDLERLSGLRNLSGEGGEEDWKPEENQPTEPETLPVPQLPDEQAPTERDSASPGEGQEAELPDGPEEEPAGEGAPDPEISGEDVWSSFRKRYPKIDAFDYDNGCEILKIKPQDIGLLPRENWVYGNNSFLLHGYYNYHCLILVRLNNPGGRPRFLLGVPGYYFSNEKYMASMFGFPHFVLSKKQPMENGRFGYWYTDVRLGQ